MSISIKDVAEHAGVSAATVSLVLNDKGNISDQTRQRVLEAVKTLGYKRNSLGRSLRSQRSYIIGYAQRTHRDALNPVMDHFLFSIADAVESAGWHVLLFNVDHANLVMPYQDLFDCGRVDGFILSYTEHNDSRFRYLHEVGVPFVAFGRSHTEMDQVTHWVDVDGAAGTYAATMHLIEQGFQDIGFVGWPPGSASGDARFDGYVRGMRECGLTIHSEWVIRVENYTFEGRKAAERILSLDTRPNAIVAISDVVAIGVQQRLAEANTRIAVTGFDDTPWTEFITPMLTSVQQPITQVAEILTDMLIRLIEERPIDTRQHLLEPRLIIRQSSLLQD